MANDKTRDLPGLGVLISITVHSQLCSARTAYVSCLIGVDKNNPQFQFDTVTELRQSMPATNSSFSADYSLYFPTNKTPLETPVHTPLTMMAVNQSCDECRRCDLDQHHPHSGK